MDMLYRAVSGSGAPGWIKNSLNQRFYSLGTNQFAWRFNWNQTIKDRLAPWKLGHHIPKRERQWTHEIYDVLHWTIQCLEVVKALTSHIFSWFFWTNWKPHPKWVVRYCLNNYPFMYKPNVNLFFWKNLAKQRHKPSINIGSNPNLLRGREKEFLLGILWDVRQGPGVVWFGMSTNRKWRTQHVDRHETSETASRINLETFQWFQWSG